MRRLTFSRKHFNGNAHEALQVYEEIRKPRATKIQAASERARENLNERIGFSRSTDSKLYKVDKGTDKLTIEEMNL
ncbi:salicylate hydroxylase [Microdochium nivale]|nr:salicylate hydroxylase [Microdochium nivale]